MRFIGFKITIRLTALAILTGSLFISPSNAASQEFTGNDLLTLCTPKENRECLLYLLGTLEGISFSISMINAGVPFEGIPDSHKSRYIAAIPCIPETVTKHQLMDVVLSELQAKPHSRHLPANSLVYSSLLNSFPCR